MKFSAIPSGSWKRAGPFGICKTCADRDNCENCEDCCLAFGFGWEVGGGRITRPKSPPLRWSGPWDVLQVCELASSSVIWRTCDPAKVKPFRCKNRCGALTSIITDESLSWVYFEILRAGPCFGDAFRSRKEMSDCETGAPETRSECISDIVLLASSSVMWNNEGMVMYEGS